MVIKFSKKLTRSIESQPLRRTNGSKVSNLETHNIIHRLYKMLQGTHIHVCCETASRTWCNVLINSNPVLSLTDESLNNYITLTETINNKAVGSQCKNSSQSKLHVVIRNTMTLEMDQVRHLCIGLMSSRIIKILHLQSSNFWHHYHSLVILEAIWSILPQESPSYPRCPSYSSYNTMKNQKLF